MFVINLAVHQLYQFLQLLAWLSSGALGFSTYCIVYNYIYIYIYISS